MGDVDLDRLADYVGGALQGTPDGTAVARLIATDPAWARAHAALTAADALVRADLTLLAAAPEPMPDAVLTRVCDALDAEPSPAVPAPEGGRARLSVLSGGRSATGSTGSPPGSRSGRRRGVVVSLAAAVVVLGLGAVGVASQLRAAGTRGAKSLAATSAGRSSTRLPPTAGTAHSSASVDVRTSGVDYSTAELSTLAAAPFAAQGHGPAKAQAGPNVLDAPPSPTPAAPRMPDELRPLTDPAARAACLRAIVARYAGTPAMLDYARFEGRPALIVLLDGAGGVAGRKWVVAVGPHCGDGGDVTDQRYSGPAG